MIFITNNKSMKVLKPGKQPFSFPTLSISSQYPAILKKTRIKSIIDKCYFVRAGTGCINDDRKTESVLRPIILVPLPFSVLPTPPPLFCRSKSSIDKAFAQVDAVAVF